MSEAVQLVDDRSAWRAVVRTWMNRNSSVRLDSRVWSLLIMTLCVSATSYGGVEVNQQKAVGPCAWYLGHGLLKIHFIIGFEEGCEVMLNLSFHIRKFNPIYYLLTPRIQFLCGTHFIFLIYILYFSSWCYWVENIIHWNVLCIGNVIWCIPLQF